MLSLANPITRKMGMNRRTYHDMKHCTCSIRYDEMRWLLVAASEQLGEIQFIDNSFEWLVVANADLEAIETVNEMDKDVNCASEPCLHGGVCTDGIDDFFCACTAAYTGKNCGIGMYGIDPIETFKNNFLQLSWPLALFSSYLACWDILLGYVQCICHLNSLNENKSWHQFTFKFKLPLSMLNLSQIFTVSFLAKVLLRACCLYDLVDVDICRYNRV